MMKRLMIFFVAAMVLSLAMQGGVVRLAILSDVHVTPGNANEGKLREAVAEINAADVDAVMLTGDLSNEGSELYLKDAGDLCMAGEHTVRDLRAMALHCGYVLLGWLDAEGRSIFNPPLEQVLTLAEADQLIVLGEE